MQTARPLVVTAGEPAGVGPELCIALARERPAAHFAVVADPEQLRSLAGSLAPGMTITELDDPRALPVPGTLNVIPLHYPAAVVPGEPEPGNAATMLSGLGLAAKACLDGRFGALVTAPLQKSSVRDAGIAFSGHTEFLAEVCESGQPVMLLVAGNLRVALATTHLPLRDVADAIDPDRLEAVLRTLGDGLAHRFGIDGPRIVVCGLNPHAGEGGHLGHEDDDVIRPVVDRLAAEGLDVVGPLPADTAFTPAAGRADAILAMYHDQGLPVLKYAGFGNAVNVTLGLPIVRTSVDHGTALDIAGRGIADPGSLLAAFDLAASLVGKPAGETGGRPS